MISNIFKKFFLHNFDPGFVGGGPAVCRFGMELRLLEKAWCSGSQAEAFMRQLS